MGGIIQNCTCLTGLAMAGELSASPQNKEPVCFSIKWCWQLVFCFFQYCTLKVCFDEAQITEVSRLKSSEFKNEIIKLLHLSSDRVQRGRCEMKNAKGSRGDPRMLLTPLTVVRVIHPAL